MKSKLATCACARLLSLAMAMLLPMDALAESGWTSYAQITELTSTNQPYFLVTLNASENPSGCRNKDIYYWDNNSNTSESMFRMLLEAVASGKMVRLYVTGNCELNGYSEISEVSIIP